MRLSRQHNELILDRPQPDQEPPRSVRGGISRRDFLRFGAMAALPLVAPRMTALASTPGTMSMATKPQPGPAPTPLGRIATWYSQAVRETPSASAALVAWKTRDEVLPLYAAVEGEPPWPTNPIWYLTDGGYIHSGYVQPVRDDPQPGSTDIVDPGVWTQVARPWAEVRRQPGSPYVATRLYYGTVYRAVAATTDDAGDIWYQLKEGYSPWSAGPWVLASSLRRIPPEEIAPISLGHADKHIQIDRATQVLRCFEGPTVVFQTQVSTGHAATPTPRGDFRVLYKRHTRRMTMSGIADPYDLPGVPFCTYFTYSGVAIHGTYWHNDYGRVHSHGCVNVTPDAAEWVFRWVDPVASYDVYTQKADPPEQGTPVTVT